MKKLLFLLPLIFTLLVSGTVEAKKKKYPNGDYYEGEWKNGKPHGNGKMIFSNGSSYYGTWADGKMLQGSAEIKLYDEGQVFRGNLNINEERFINDYYFSGFDYNHNNLIMEGEFLNDMSIFFSGKFTLRTFENVFVFYGSISNDGDFNGKMNYMQDQYAGLTAKYDGGLDNILRSGKGDLSFSKYEMNISGFWSDDMLMQGSGSFVYDGTLCNFNIKQSDPLDYNSSYIVELSNPYNETNYLKLPFNDNLESIPDLITMEYRKKADIEIKKRRELAEQKRIQEEENRRKDAERKRIEQENLKQKQIALEKAKKQAEIERIEKDYKSFNIASHIWTTSDIRRLYEENPLKCRNIVGSAPIILVGRIVDITLNRIYLQNDIILTDFDKDDKDVINLQKGQLIYAFTDIKKVEYGSLIFESPRMTGNQMHLWTVIKPNLNGLKPSITRYDDENQKYVFEHLVKNIYR